MDTCERLYKEAPPDTTDNIFQHNELYITAPNLSVFLRYDPVEKKEGAMIFQ